MQHQQKMSLPWCEIHPWLCRKFPNATIHLLEETQVVPKGRLAPGMSLMELCADGKAIASTLIRFPQQMYATKPADLIWTLFWPSYTSIKHKSFNRLGVEALTAE